MRVSPNLNPDPDPDPDPSPIPNPPPNPKGARAHLGARARVEQPHRPRAEVRRSRRGRGGGGGGGDGDRQVMRCVARSMFSERCCPPTTLPVSLWRILSYLSGGRTLDVLLFNAPAPSTRPELVRDGDRGFGVRCLPDAARGRGAPVPRGSLLLRRLLEAPRGAAPLPRVPPAGAPSQPEQGG